MKDLPKSIRVITGDQHKVQKTIDDFFVSTINYLVDEFGANKRYFEIKLEGTYKEPPSMLENKIPLDNRIHMLRYKEGVVAVVLQTRTEFNNVQYDFFRNLKNFIK